DDMPTGKPVCAGAGKSRALRNVHSRRVDEFAVARLSFSALIECPVRDLDGTRAAFSQKSSGFVIEHATQILTAQKWSVGVQIEHAQIVDRDRAAAGCGQRSGAVPMDCAAIVPHG